MPTQVAIVGGGLAGLVAARQLYEAGVDFQVVEARDRLGGRILSADASGLASDDGFDVGPSWFWPSVQPEMEKLVKALGLTVFPQHAEGDVIVDRHTLEGPQRFRAMRQEPASMRLAGGTGGLVTALAASLPSDRLSIGAKVTNITIASQSVALIVARQDCAPQMIEAAQVILAVPPRLLAETISFEPALDSRILAQWQRTATWMAPHAKFFALYERPFWRDVGLSGDAQSFIGPLVEIHDATTASGQAALFVFYGPAEARRAAMGEEILNSSALTQLVRLFGPKAAHPIATLFKDWSADTLTATLADRVASGHLAASWDSWLRAPWDNLVVLASSETSSVAPGYLAGAVDAGSRAAVEVISRLKVTGGEVMAC